MERARCGTPQYHCKDCGTYRVLQPKPVYSEGEKQTILQACLERSRLRGVQRIFGAARQTIAEWIKIQAKALPEIKDILLASAPDDVLELDEVWRFVVKKYKRDGCGQRCAAERAKSWHSWEQYAAATCWPLRTTDALIFQG